MNPAGAHARVEVQTEEGWAIRLRLPPYHSGLGLPSTKHFIDSRLFVPRTASSGGTESAQSTTIPTAV
jgi:hypothetical protein